MLTLFRVFQAGSYFLHIVDVAILVYVVLSWFRPSFRFFYWLSSFVSPFIRPFRGLSEWIMRRTGIPLDFSCWFAVIGLQIINRLWWWLYYLLRAIT